MLINQPIKKPDTSTAPGFKILAIKLFWAEEFIIGRISIQTLTSVIYFVNPAPFLHCISTFSSTHSFLYRDVLIYALVRERLPLLKTLHSKQVPTVRIER